MVLREPLSLSQDHPAGPIARISGSDKRNRSWLLLRSLTGLGLAPVCWALLVAFAAPAAADGTTPVGAPPSDAAMSDVQAPEGSPQPGAVPSLEPSGTPAPGVPTSEGAQPPADAVTPAQPPGVQLPVEGQSASSVAVAVASSVVQAPPAVVEPPSALPPPAPASEAGPPVEVGTEAPGTPGVESSVGATVPSEASGGDPAVVPAWGAGPPIAGPPGPPGVPSSEGGLPVEGGVAAPVVQEAVDEQSATSVAVAVASSVVQAPPAVADVSGARAPQVPASEGGSPVEGGVAAPEVAASEGGSPVQGGVTAPEVPAPEGGSPVEVAVAAPGVSFSLEGESVASVAVAITSSFVATPGAPADPSVVPASEAGPPVAAGTEAPGTPGMHSSDGDAPPEAIRPGALPLEVPSSDADLSDGSAGVRSPGVPLSLGGESAGSVAVAVASSVVATPATVADPPGVPVSEAGPPVEAGPESPSAPSSLSEAVPTEAIPTEGSSGDPSGASPEADPPVEAGAESPGVTVSEGRLPGDPIGVTAPGVQLSLDGESSGSLALAVALSVAQTPAAVPPAGSPEESMGPAPEAPTAPSPQPAVQLPELEEWEIAMSVEPAAASCPGIELSLGGQSAGPVALAVAVAVVQETVRSATCDQSVAVAVAVAAM
jgi:hypothetical protein